MKKNTKKTEREQEVSEPPFVNQVKKYMDKIGKDSLTYTETGVKRVNFGAPDFDYVKEKFIIKVDRVPPIDPHGFKFLISYLFVPFGLFIIWLWAFNAKLHTLDYSDPNTFVLAGAVSMVLVVLISYPAFLMAMKQSRGWTSVDVTKPGVKVYGYSVPVKKGGK